MADTTDARSATAATAIPSDDALRTMILRTVGPNYYPTRDAEPSSTPIDLTNYTPEQRDRIMGSRLQLGPGTKANSYQKEAHKLLMERVAEEAEIERVMALYNEVRYDQTTGDPVPARSEDERNRLLYAASQAQSKLDLLKGAGGDARLARALEKAVGEERARAENRYIEAEAQRRASANTLEDRIRIRADEIRSGAVKTVGR